MKLMAETETPKAPEPPAASEDDRRATLAAENRKRTEKDWEEKKKRWRDMGVPAPLPAAGSSKSKK